MIEIDGAMGEGGGQVLRTALSLSALTGEPVHLSNIRQRRKEPGLLAQHLRSVEAARQVCRAQVSGAYFRSQELVFEPGALRSGRYRFEIATAGAAPLVFQTVFLPLSRAGGASSVTITGGTHVRWAPCFEYLALHWLPYLQQAGFDARLDLVEAGFYPQGGGRIDAVMRPAATTTGLELVDRGALKSLTGISAVANLDLSIAERQKHQALRRLRPYNPKINTVQLPSRFKGTLLLLLATFERSRCCYFGLGALGKPAEKVADEAIDQLEAFLATPAAIDQYLADQLLLPLSLASEPSTLYTSQVTAHLLTNAGIIQRFLPVEIAIDGAAGEPGKIRITP